MIGKKDLKDELNLPSVSVISELLKAAGRPTRSQLLEDADASLVRKAVPYWRKGHDYTEAVRLAKAELLDQVVEEQEKATDLNNGNGKDKPANSTLAIQHQVQRQKAALDKKNEAFSQQATLTKAVGDERKNQALYWYARAAAAASSQVQESEEVVTARDFYFQMQSGDVAGTDVVADMEATLEDLGFFNSDGGLNLESLMPVADGYSQEPCSYPNGSETESIWQ